MRGGGGRSRSRIAGTHIHLAGPSYTLYILFVAQLHRGQRNLGTTIIEGTGNGNCIGLPLARKVSRQRRRDRARGIPRDQAAPAASVKVAVKRQI